MRYGRPNPIRGRLAGGHCRLDAERLSSGHLLVDVLTLLESLLPQNDLRETLDEEVAELNLRHSQTVGVGDIPSSSGGSGVDASSSAGLEAHLLQHVLEVGTGGEERQLDHSASTQSRSQVGGAREDKAEVVILHEFVAIALQGRLNCLRRVAKTREDRGDVISLLHGHNTHLILLVHPHEEVLSVVVEDTTRIGPMAAAARAEQQRRIGLLEQVPVGTQLPFLLLRHASIISHGPASVQREILPLQLAAHLVQAVDDDTLSLTALLKGAGRRERQSAHGATRAATSGQHVLAIRVDLGLRQLADVHIRDVLGVRCMSSITLSHDDVEKVLKSFKAFLVARNETTGHDVRVARVVDASLDALGQGDSALGGQAFVLLVDLWVVAQSFSAEVSVLGEIWERIWALVARESSALLRADVLVIAAAQLDPLWKLQHSRSEALRWVRRHLGDIERSCREQNFHDVDLVKRKNDAALFRLQ